MFDKLQKNMVISSKCKELEQVSRTEAEKRAQVKYDEKYRKRGVTKSYHFKCHKEHDADIIEVLEAQENKNGYIKDLIRNDIEKQG